MTPEDRRRWLMTRVKISLITGDQITLTRATLLKELLRFIALGVALLLPFILG